MPPIPPPHYLIEICCSRSIDGYTSPFWSLHKLTWKWPILIANLEKCSIGIWENESNACHVDVEIDFSQIPICSPINISMSLIIPGAIYPMPIYNSVKYLRRRVLKKKWSAFSCYLFLLNALSYMFGRFLNTPILRVLNKTYYI